MSSVIGFGCGEVCGQKPQLGEERPGSRSARRTTALCGLFGRDRGKEHLSMLARRVDDDGGKFRELAELVGFDDGLINRPV